jgi:hypothetical protein
MAVVFAVSHGDQASARPAREKYMESARAYGRGGTYIAAYESDEATFLNPATLAEPNGKTVQFRWAQLDGFVGENTVDTISEIADIKPGQTSPVSLLQQFSDKFGKQQYLRFQAAPLGIRILSFDMAPFFSTSNWIDMRVPTTPETWIHSDTFAGANFSLAMGFGKQFYVGITARPFFRTLFDTDLAFAEIMEFEPMGDLKAADVFKLYSGAGVGFDVGTIFTFGKGYRLGMKVADLGGTGYSLSTTDSADQPPIIQPNLSMGIMKRLDYKPWRLDWAVDMQDIMNPDDISYLRTFQGGIELGRAYRTLDNDMGVTLGLHEGYLCFGAFIDMWLVRLDALSYAVEIGEIPGQRQDRRTAFTARSSLYF